MKAPALGALLVLAACAHPEDRRWARLVTRPAPAALPKPKLSAYSFASAADPQATLSVKDLSGEGQAAYLALLDAAKDRAALRGAVAAPIAAGKGLPATARPRLNRTIVVGVQKDLAAGVGDRLMRTVVTIEPHDKQFEFAGYTVVATDNQVQSIAHLDSTTDAALALTLAPEVPGLGDKGVEGKVEHKKETSADIAQQYEKLNVDIEPGRITVTRESERGLDVVGNTILKVSIVPLPPAGIGSGISVFLVGDQTLFKDGAALEPKDAGLSMDLFASPLRCALQADVSLAYRARHVVKGVEYYTEGKQQVQLVDDAVGPNRIDLVRADETAPDLWQVLVGDPASPVLARRVDGAGRILVFDNYDAAQIFAAWLRKTGAAAIGKNGTTLSAGGRTAVNADVLAAPYRYDCAAAPAAKGP